MIWRTPAMIISLFTFAISWGLYAFSFYGLTRIFHNQFHSSYSESTFTIAFLIGFLDAAFLKALRVMNFKTSPFVLFLASAGINILLIFATSGGAETYYVTGHKAPVLSGLILAAVMVVFEVSKIKFFSDARL